jgi:hypothetical protein
LTSRATLLELSAESAAAWCEHYGIAAPPALEDRRRAVAKQLGVSTDKLTMALRLMRACYRHETRAQLMKLQRSAVRQRATDAAFTFLRHLQSAAPRSIARPRSARCRALS